MSVKMKRLHLFNFLTNTKEIFEPEKKNHVFLYKCGPTVYDLPHLGHARIYIYADCLERYLKHQLGYSLTTVMNITDLDDKIIEKGSPTEEYEKIFFETMNQLNIIKPDYTPRVTENLQIIYDFVHEGLKDYCYKAEEDGKDILFDWKKCLRNRVFPDLKNRDAAAAPRTKTKRNDPRDFVLWKSNKNWTDSKGNQHDTIPGWHSECAALAAHYLGDSIDIHIGGIDLKFPHHENEITLGRIYFNRDPWVRFCLYVGHVQIKGEKMSKSLKNFTTVEDLINRGYSPLAIRYMFLKYPHAKRMEFNDQMMKSAQKSYNTLMHHLQMIKQYLLDDDDDSGGGGESDWNNFTLLQNKINNFLMDNLNIPSALETLENYIYNLSLEKFTKSWLQYCFSYILWLTDNIFGLIIQKDDKKEKELLFQTVKQFRCNVRHCALTERSENLLKMCDDLREELNKMGYEIQDK